MTRIVRLIDEVIRKWNEEDHPREPAGSEGGGQFAPAGGDGGSGNGGGSSHEDLSQKYGDAVAKEGLITAYPASNKHGTDHSVNNKPVPRVDVILFRGNKSPKEFGTIKSRVESSTDRGTGGPTVASSRGEKVVYELRTSERPLLRFTSFKAAMKDAERQRQERHRNKFDDE